MRVCVLLLLLLLRHRRHVCIVQQEEAVGIHGTYSTYNKHAWVGRTEKASRTGPWMPSCSPLPCPCSAPAQGLCPTRYYGRSRA